MRERLMARRLRLRVAVLPSLFTLGNGICGFASILVAAGMPAAAAAENGAAQALHLLYVAGWLIFAGMVFDVLDGRVARMSGSASKFGAELDSLCDAVTFGVAPAFLLLRMAPNQHWLIQRILFVPAALYFACTVLRLARFNVETTPDLDSHRYFKGLPSPAAAGCVAAGAVCLQDFAASEGTFREFFSLAPLSSVLAQLMPFGAALLAGLMVSSIRYPHLVNQSLRGRRPFRHLVSLIVVIVLFAGMLLVATGLALLVAFWSFALMGPVQHLLRKRTAEEPAASILGPLPNRPRPVHPELE